jgi:hypothetical protein
MGTVDPMKPDDLLDYALGQFEGPAKDTVESAIADDPDLSFKADRLALTLGLLLDDGDEIEPPAGLASKTVAGLEAGHPRLRPRPRPFPMGRPRRGRRRPDGRPPHALASDERDPQQGQPDGLRIQPPAAWLQPGELRDPP